MILNAVAEKLKRQSKDDFKGRHFEAWLIGACRKDLTGRNYPLNGVDFRLC